MELTDYGIEDLKWKFSKGEKSLCYLLSNPFRVYQKQRLSLFPYHVGVANQLVCH